MDHSHTLNSELSLASISEPLSFPAKEVDAITWSREQRRRYILNLLDIELLISRKDPPGAAKACRRAAPTAEVTQTFIDIQTAKTDGAIEIPTTRSPKNTTRSLANEHPISAINLENNQTKLLQINSLTDDAQALMADELVTFSLLMATAGCWLWVELLPHNVLYREQLQLIQGMARAIAGPNSSMTHLQFNWPLSSHPNLPKNLESACQSVAGKIQRLLQQPEVKGIMVLGENTEPYLAATQKNNDEIIKKVILPSTAQMLEEPKYKKIAWQMLTY